MCTNCGWAHSLIQRRTHSRESAAWSVHEILGGENFGRDGRGGDLLFKGFFSVYQSLDCPTQIERANTLLVEAIVFPGPDVERLATGGDTCVCEQVRSNYYHHTMQGLPDVGALAQAASQFKFMQTVANTMDGPGQGGGGGPQGGGIGGGYGYRGGYNGGGGGFPGGFQRPKGCLKCGGDHYVRNCPMAQAEEAARITDPGAC